MDLQGCLPSTKGAKQGCSRKLSCSENGLSYRNCWPKFQSSNLSVGVTVFEHARLLFVGAYGEKVHSFADNSTLVHSNLLYSTTVYRAILYCTVLCVIIPYYTILYDSKPYHTMHYTPSFRIQERVSNRGALT